MSYSCLYFLYESSRLALYNLAYLYSINFKADARIKLY